MNQEKYNSGMQQGWDIYLGGEKLCGKGPGASGEHKLHMSEQGGATAKKKPTGSWAAPKSSSAAEIKKSLHHSAQCFPEHTWKLIFVPSIQNKTVNRLERVQRAKMIIQGLKSLPCEERLRERLCSALRKQDLGEILSP